MAGAENGRSLIERTESAVNSFMPPPPTPDAIAADPPLPLQWQDALDSLLHKVNLALATHLDIAQRAEIEGRSVVLQAVERLTNSVDSVAETLHALPCRGGKRCLQPRPKRRA